VLLELGQAPPLGLHEAGYRNTGPLRDHRRDIVRLDLLLEVPVLRLKLGEPSRRDFDRGFGIDTFFDRERYEHYQFGITRATAAIAESGSLVIDDDRTADRLAALAPWIHVAVLERSSIVRTIPEAIAAFDQSPNIIWVTGPSKTADVEGILIEGVHGPGEQIALLV